MTEEDEEEVLAELDALIAADEKAATPIDLPEVPSDELPTPATDDQETAERPAKQKKVRNVPVALEA